jgi:hypothetical protein
VHGRKHAARYETELGIVVLVVVPGLGELAAVQTVRAIVRCVVEALAPMQAPQVVEHLLVAMKLLSVGLDMKQCVGLEDALLACAFDSQVSAANLEAEELETSSTYFGDSRLAIELDLDEVSATQTYRAGVQENQESNGFDLQP